MEVRNIKLTSIDTRGRVREDFGDLKSLAGSIKQNGLVEPLAVCPQQDRTYPYRLLAGDRRLRAIKMFLKWEEVPAHIMKSIKDMEQILGVEKAENTDRKDFTPKEKFKMAKKLSAVIGDRRKVRPGKGKQHVDNRPLIDVPKGIKTRDVVAKMAGFDSQQDMRRYQAIEKSGVPGLVEMVNKNKVAISTAAAVAALPKSEQVDIVAGGAQAIKEAARKIRERGETPKGAEDEFVIVRGEQMVPVDVQVRFPDPASTKRYVSINAERLWKTLTSEFGYLSLSAGETTYIEIRDKDGYSVKLNCRLESTESGKAIFVAPKQEIRIHDPEGARSRQKSA
jgi:ParB/RepB/Spo0J family partition protein